MPEFRFHFPSTNISRYSVTHAVGVKGQKGKDWIWFNPRYLCALIGCGYDIMVPWTENETHALILNHDKVVGVLCRMKST